MTEAYVRECEMLTCQECGSHAVVMAGPPQEGADVCCGECGCLLGTYPAFFTRFAVVAQAAMEPQDGNPGHPKTPASAVQTLRWR